MNKFCKGRTLGESTLNKKALRIDVEIFNGWVSSQFLFYKHMNFD